MNKKSLNRKEAQKFIIESRNNGKTDQEIYNELAQQYFDKKVIAMLILGTAKAENIDKYRYYNYTLVILLGISILLKFFTVINLTLYTGELWILLFTLLVPLMNIYFMYEIVKYNATVYRMCGIFAILGVVQTFNNSEFNIDLLIYIIFSSFVMILSFYLYNKLFPNYNPKELKKNGNGEYILD